MTDHHPDLAPDAPTPGEPTEATQPSEATPPSELAAKRGIRPDMSELRPLRVPSSPQREHIMAEAEALRRYIEEGGPVSYFRSNQPGDRARVAFLVDRQRFNRTAAALRTERTGNRPWVWQPKRGLHRTSSTPDDPSGHPTANRGPTPPEVPAGDPSAPPAT